MFESTLALVEWMENEIATGKVGLETDGVQWRGESHPSSLNEGEKNRRERLMGALEQLSHIGI